MELIYSLLPIVTFFLVLDFLSGLVIVYVVLKTKKPEKPVDKKELFKYTLLLMILGIVFESAWIFTST